MKSAMTAGAGELDERKLKWQGQAQLSTDTVPERITPVAASSTELCGLITTDSEVDPENETGHSSEQIKGTSATSSTSTTVRTRPNKPRIARIES